MGGPDLCSSSALEDLRDITLCDITQFKDGAPHGRGVHQAADGGSYAGNFCNGLKQASKLQNLNEFDLKMTVWQKRAGYLKRM